jgi:hypothetical protein
VDPVPDPLLLRKSGSAANRTQDLWICSQKCLITMEPEGTSPLYNSPPVDTDPTQLYSLHTNFVRFMLLLFSHWWEGNDVVSRTPGGVRSGAGDRGNNSWRTASVTGIPSEAGVGSDAGVCWDSGTSSDARIRKDNSLRSPAKSMHDVMRMNRRVTYHTTFQSPTFICTNVVHTSEVRMVTRLVLLMREN